MFAMPQKIHKLLCSIFADLFSLLLVYLPWIILNVIDHPFHRGFYCNDESLRYPYKPSTVKSTYLYVAIVLISLMIFLVELGINYSKHRHKMESPMYQCDIKLPSIVINSYKNMGYFLFGCAAQQTATNIGKFSIGRLRPHFFSMCQPNFTDINCLDKSGHYRYITEYECTGVTDDNTYDITNMRKSFPSGHASLSVYCAVYFCIYIHARVSKYWSFLLKHFIQVIVIFMALYTSLSRISDYKHHWSDVLAGAILGMFSAIVTAVFIAKLFNKQKEDKLDVPECSTSTKTLVVNADINITSQQNDNNTEQNNSYYISSF